MERPNRYRPVPALQPVTLRPCGRARSTSEPHAGSSGHGWSSTRAQIEDLRSDSPTAGWRRDIWLDALTLFRILGGAGWLAGGIPGALGGTAITAVGTWFIVRNRQRSRPATIRHGEETLRSSERELHAAEHEAVQAVFSASEATTGIPDGNR